MADFRFALFIDVMGVKHDLRSRDDRIEESKAFDRCEERLQDFHRDLSRSVDDFSAFVVAKASSGEVPPALFIAEFSDAAYIVAEKFATVAHIGIALMRDALRHEYPLRGGIGFGTFGHTMSGIRSTKSGQVWSTSSFLGSSIVGAYQAERSTTPGLRILIHPNAIGSDNAGSIKDYALELSPDESCEDSKHELRIWSGSNQEAKLARDRLSAFRNKQELSKRAQIHYQATVNAYERFDQKVQPLPHVLPALWL